MANISGQGLGRALCDIWGLNVNEVQSITIRANARDVAHVDVRMLITTDKDKSLKELLTRYKLCEGEEIQ